MQMRDPKGMGLEQGALPQKQGLGGGGMNLDGMSEEELMMLLQMLMQQQGQGGQPGPAGGGMPPGGM